jgi:outer membrane protein assembly factor BamB
MKRLKLVICFSLLLSANTFTPANAQNWPYWRGPNGDGTSPETNLPVRWDSTTNVTWKTAVPGTGYSSPIVWNDRIFTCTALPETEEKMLLCFNTENGDLLWKQTVVKGRFEGKHNDNSFASGTPATDGKLVYVSFLDGQDVVVAAYDFSGRQIWIQRPGTFSSPHGYSCSPVLYEDKVIINGDSKGDSFLAALSRADGHLIWKTPHERPAHSFTTPIFRNMAGKMQMIFGGNKEIASYNPNNGSKYWFVSGPSEDFTSSPVYNEKSGLVIYSSAWPKRFLLGIRPDGSGDVSQSHVAWQSTAGACYVPSPLSIGDYIFSTMINGKLHCMDASTGNVLWTMDNGKQYSSPVTAGGLVYVPNDEGVIKVIKPGPTYELVSTNPIGEKMFASPAISNGKIYLRSLQHLYCIGQSTSEKQ